MLPVSKLKTLSEISRDIGQVVFASVFVEPFVNGSVTPLTLMTGLAFSVLSWLLSLVFARE